jgi:hypothetical protein
VSIGDLGKLRIRVCDEPSPERGQEPFGRPISVHSTAVCKSAARAWAEPGNDNWECAMATRVQETLNNNGSKADMVRAAVGDLAEESGPAEAKKLVEELSNERIPQESGHRAAVAITGLAAAVVLVLSMVAAVIVLTLNDKTIPDAAWVLVTAVASGIVGGLFGARAMSTS